MSNQGVHWLDFATCDAETRRALMTPLSGLARELSTRALNFAVDDHLKSVGDLAQITSGDIFRTPNVGRKTLNELNGVLQKRGFEFGMNIDNWPEPNEFDDLAQKMRTDVPALPNSPYSYVEEELTAAVELMVPKQSQKIVFCRTGFDGGNTYTLDEIGRNPALSGKEQPVTRERIRQIEAKALRQLSKLGFRMPVLDEAMSCISAEAPIAEKEVPKLLRRAGLSNTQVDFRTLRLAFQTLGKETSLDLKEVGGIAYVIREDQNGLINDVINIYKRARNVDFLLASDLEDIIPDSVKDPTTWLRSQVETFPILEWLDLGERVLWSPPPFKQKSHLRYVCRKLFSVADDLSLERLQSALKRARTIDTVPSRKILRVMLNSWGEFRLDDGIVHRNPGAKLSQLNQRDIMLLSVFLDSGVSLDFNWLSRELVKRGISSNHANVLMVTSPLVFTPRRGQYRCIAGPQEIARALENIEPTDEVVDEENEGATVEFVVNAKQLTIGTHRLSDVAVDPGVWTVFEVVGREKGSITLSGKRLSGLKEVLSNASVRKGDTVWLMFRQSSRTVTLSVIR